MGEVHQSVGAQDEYVAGELVWKGRHIPSARDREGVLTGWDTAGDGVPDV